ncbi:MAG TPA: DUF1587 domain-containing protein, partial [Isosphaeraceae bacterium]|nr:DUF1587 domain-containing protein [Isosphaeraceae bacterium]
MQPTRDSALAWWTSSVVACLLGLMVPGGSARAADDPAAERFQEEIQPILMEYCYGCHGMGSKKGDVSFEELETDAAALQKRDLWWTVLKNVRSGIMPPAGKPRPSDKEKLLLADWIKRGVFKIDPQDPDPGRVTIRRLNRVEYRNTIHDLMGIDFKTEEEFPPDDTGYGFDTIGDVLCVSPLLLEKYMQAAESIVAVAVPKLSKVISEQKMRGSEFRAAEGEANGDRLTFYKEANVSHTFKVEQEGDYRLLFEVAVNGDFDFDPGRCTVSMKLDDWEVLSEAYRWQDHKTFRYELKEHLSPGEHPLAFELTPLTKLEDKRTSVDFRVVSVQIEGPLEERFWTHPKNYDRFFSRDEPPTSTMERRQYAREILSRFTKKAFRRPVDDRTIDRLVWIAEDGYGQPGKRFEEGVAHAIVAVLASPRFLFRVEEPEATQAASPHPLIDEYALASRLSYFLWSTMPDDELVGLAERGELRKNLGAQVKRMLADPRSKEMIENFTGQWLQVRDIEGISIDARWVLARDNGEEKELKQAIEDFKARLAKLQEEKKAEAQNKDAAQNKDQAQAKAQRPNRGRLFARPAVELDG